MRTHAGGRITGPAIPLATDPDLAYQSPGDWLSLW